MSWENYVIELCWS